MITRFVLILALAMTSLLGDHKAAASERKLPTLSGKDRAVLRYASLSLARKNVAQVRRWLLAQKRVSRASVGADARTLNIQFRNGSNAAILPPWPDASHLAKSHFLTQDSASQTGTAASQKALVLEPFATEEIGTHDADPEIRVLQANGFKVAQLSDESVTVAEMASLWKYGLVYIHTHAGVNSAGYSVFSTGQVANGDPAVQPLMQEGSVMVVGVSGLAQQYYGVLIPYIQRYEGQFPANSLIYLDTCDLGRAGPLWQAFASKGVGAMVTWDGHSIFRDETAAAQAFFAAMGQGDTVNSALQAVHSQGLDTSTWQGSIARLGIFGDGYITLQGRAKDAPTDTPIPTLTDTPTVTPTFSPTATASPTNTAVPLKVSLKKLVKPGQLQAISITSAPSADVAVTVTFPNGDQVFGSGIGKLRYSYRQKESKIRHGDRTATVVVEANLDGRVSTSRQTYSIGFGHVDASVTPRVQALGKRVTVWAHSKPFTAITLRLLSRSRTVAETTGRTGPRGWLHRSYPTTVGGSRGALIVEASLSGSHGFRTSTSFVVD